MNDYFNYIEPHLVDNMEFWKEWRFDRLANYLWRIYQPRAKRDFVITNFTFLGLFMIGVWLDSHSHSDVLDTLSLIRNFF